MVLGFTWSLFMELPEIVKAIAYVLTGGGTVLAFVIKWLSGKDREEQQVVQEWRAKYIELNTDFLRSVTNETKQRRLLLEMAAFCGDCYKESEKNSGITLDN